MMKKTGLNRKSILILALLLMLQVIAAFCFCGQKTGYHYDELYSYYSSNVTNGIGPWDQTWTSGDEIFQEFAVLPGEGFSFARVAQMQSYDVHPPVYYFFLHAICSLMPGVFSKWAGLLLNVFFFVGSWCLLGWLAWHLGGRRYQVVLAALLLYGCSPAVLSGIMLVRMYTMLGFWILLTACLHVRALEKEKTGWKFCLPLAGVVIAGFLTHYYYAVYLFFLAATMEGYLLFVQPGHKNTVSRLKDCFIYGFSVIGAMLLSVLLYPASASHIFRGYRGTEAMGAFFDLGNTGYRIRFFAQLLNEYAFGSMLPVLALVLILAAMTYAALFRFQKRKDTALKFTEWAYRQRTRLVTALAAAGYFAVVTKTALLTAEEANRYQIPVYGMLIMLAVILLFVLPEKIAVQLAGMKKDEKASPSKWGMLPAVLLVLLIAGGQVAGLCSGKVLFLYPDDKDAVAFAQENADTTVVYFYNENNKWMPWDDALELMQYDNLYFVSLADAETMAQKDFSDARIAQADRILVYSMRHDDSQKALELLLDACGSVKQCEKIRELLYCDLYELTP